MLARRFMRLFSLGILATLALDAQAASNKPIVIVAPQCLVKEAHTTYQTLATTKKFVLLETDNEGLEKLIEAKSVKQAKPCGGFMDVTVDWEAFNAKKAPSKEAALTFLKKEVESETPSTKAKTSPYTIRYEKEVNEALYQINPTAMMNKLSILTNFKDRHANSETGVSAASLIKSNIDEMAKTYKRDHEVEAYFVETGTRYKQPSVVVKFGKDLKGSAIVIGAHMDTLAAFTSNKPGADDDGSGSVTVMEIVRTIFASQLHFNRPIYFIWYAAEEQGLVGSSYVVADFKKKGIPVEAVLHFDMTGYAYKNDPTMWLITDHTNKDLTNFLETLINTYVKQPVKRTACGYACSDHASWTKGGFIAAMPFESSFNTDNPYIHSAEDTIDKLSIVHMTNFLKLGTAFAIELAEPAV